MSILATVVLAGWGVWASAVAGDFLSGGGLLRASARFADVMLWAGALLVVLSVVLAFLVILGTS